MEVGLFSKSYFKIMSNNMDLLQGLNDSLRNNFLQVLLKG